MLGRLLAVVCAAVLIPACGKKAAPTGGDSPPSAPGPGAGGPGGKKDLPKVDGTKKDGPKVDPPKVDVDGYIDAMKANAGKLRSDSHPGAEALKRLTDNVPPTHVRRADVYKALVETAGKMTPSEIGQYLYWIPKYAGPEDAAALVAFVRNHHADPGACDGAFARLVEFKEPTTFEPIAAMLDDPVGKLRLESAKALKGIGAKAEKAVQVYATPTGPGGKENGFVLRTVAIQILGDIGTAESVPLLQSLAQDKNSTIVDLAKKAVAAIQSRKK